MVKVKFNARTSVHMIPDNKIDDIRTNLEALELEDIQKYITQVNVLARRFQFKDAKIGDIIEVPQWYYEANKGKSVAQGVSFDKYTDKGGHRSPFNTAEAVKHGDMTDPTKTMQIVKLFDLVEETKKSK